MDAQCFLFAMRISVEIDCFSLLFLETFLIFYVCAEIFPERFFHLYEVYLRIPFALLACHLDINYVKVFVRPVLKEKLRYAVFLYQNF